jgi:hypothetical protein
MPGSQIVIGFDAPANQGCTVQFATNLFTGPWTTVTNYPAVGTNRVIQLIAPAPGGSGFFRLRSP